ncbi:unnamed protein product [Cuscuta campestris]|uniref:Uncharacterized protein n=1 Tax=Cuscuta campestris TaxID=132261 RepID=A0A484NH71_9ASTE|nr:unnamed protein product [Cuscuta campestris]
MGLVGTLGTLAGVVVAWASMHDNKQSMEKKKQGLADTRLPKQSPQTVEAPHAVAASVGALKESPPAVAVGPPKSLINEHSS